MYKAKIFKAQGIGEQEVKSLHIEFDEEVPREACEEAFAVQGLDLEFLLYNILPGGTYDQLLGRMLKRKAGKLIVSYGGLEMPLTNRKMPPKTKIIYFELLVEDKDTEEGQS